MAEQHNGHSTSPAHTSGARVGSNSGNDGSGSMVMDAEQLKRWKSRLDEAQAQDASTEVNTGKMRRNQSIVAGLQLGRELGREPSINAAGRRNSAMCITGTGGATGGSRLAGRSMSIARGNDLVSAGLNNSSPANNAISSMINFLFLCCFRLFFLICFILWLRNFCHRKYIKFSDTQLFQGV